MRNFADHKLSKSQMNKIAGGKQDIKQWYCISNPGPEGPYQVYIVEAESAEAAADSVHILSGSDQVNCTSNQC